MADGSRYVASARGDGYQRPIEELRFVVVGAYVVDCFVNTERLPQWDHEDEAHSIRTSPGGKALNQAVAFARLGGQVSAVGAVGDDAIGRDILATLTRERVAVDWIEKRPGAATAICLCFVSGQGDSAIMWHIDDDVAVLPGTVRAAGPAIERADAVLVTFEMSADAIAESIRLGGRHGGLVVVQPAPVLADQAAAASLPWDQVDVLVPNESEARELLIGRGRRAHDVPTDELAGALAAELGVPTVVATLGASGCVAHADGVSREHPAHAAVAVDTTGASDAFTATLSAWLAAGAPVPHAVDAAQAAAAFAVQHAGGHKSMPASASPG